VEQLKVLEKDYDDRHQYWAGESLEPALAQLLLQTAHEPAVAFYRLAFDELIPAVRGRQSGRRHAAAARIQQAYDAIGPRLTRWWSWPRSAPPRTRPAPRTASGPP